MFLNPHPLVQGPRHQPKLYIFGWIQSTTNLKHTHTQIKYNTKRGSIQTLTNTATQIIIEVS